MQAVHLGPLYISATHGGPLQGMVAIEAGDFADVWHNKVARGEDETTFRHGSTFGKTEPISEKGVNFNGRRLRKVGHDILVDMKAFVEKRLQPVKLSPEQAGQKKE